jgi:hypothetical protein
MLLGGLMIYWMGVNMSQNRLKENQASNDSPIYSMVDHRPKFPPLAAGLLCALTVWMLSMSGALADNQKQARQLFVEGNDLFDKKNYEMALEKFREARRLFQSYKIDLNIAITLDALGRQTEAAEYFEFFLASAEKVAPQDFVKSARVRLHELRRQLGSIQIACLVNEAAVTVDGKMIGKTPLQQRIYLQPGAHQIAVSKEGFAPISLPLKITAGENKEVLVPLQKKATSINPMDSDTDLGAGASAGSQESTSGEKGTASGSTATASSSGETTEALVKESLPPADDAQRRKKTIWGYSAVGGGAACVITAVILYGIGTSQGSTAHDEYDKARQPEDIERHWNEVESARQKLIAGHVLASVGLAATGFGLYQLLTRPAATLAPPQATAAGITLGLSADGRGFIFKGHF